MKTADKTTSNAKAPLDSTINSLCKAHIALKKMEFLEIRLVDEATAEIHRAILDLCGVPEDNTADGDWQKPDLFCRDWLGDQLDELLSEPPGEDFTGLRALMVNLTKEAFEEKSREH